jgi:MFS family permease
VSVDGKIRSISLLLIAEVAAMSLWFVSAAVLPDMLREAALSPFRQAALSSGVQAGFVVGALTSAVLGLADRFDPRHVFAVSAICAGLANATLLVLIPGSLPAIAARVATGALLAGVYPVGMKIAVGWGQKDRGFLVGALVGALTLGAAFPHLLALAGGANWRLTVAIASIAAIAAGLLCLTTVSLGPHHGIAARFNPKAIATAWTNRRVRFAYAGYLGHMWELYAMWAWIAAATAASYGASLPMADAQQLAKLTAFIAIGAGGIACAFAGSVADRIGKAEVTIVAMALSGSSALAAALTFGGPVWITFVIVILWGLTVIPDSAQFSALVADASPPQQAGSLMTFQTALGFALTFATVQITPVLAAHFGWPPVLAGLAIGPALGIAAMWRLRRMG